MQTLTRETSEKLFKLMPEVLEKCENWWYHYKKAILNRNKIEWECVNHKYNQSPKFAYSEGFPAPTIEDILDNKFIGALTVIIYPKELHGLDYGIYYIAQHIAYNYRTKGKLPAVEKYLLELLEVKT